MKGHNVSIDVGDYTFPYASSVEVTSSWEELTDVATITTPRKITFQGQTIAAGESLFKRGDALEIRLGYDGQYDKVFTGYVSGISPGVPLTFRGEDAMWKLKQSSYTLSYKNPTLKQILGDCVNIPFEAVDAELGPIRLTNQSGAQILEFLRKEYGLQSWVRDGKLYSGLAYRPDMASRHTFRYEQNIISDTLEYVREDDIQFKVKAISIQNDNSKIEVDLGDPAGETRTLIYVNLSQSELRATAERELSRLRYEGYRGSFLTFGQPMVKHGDFVTIEDPRYPDRSGTYLVKRVTTSGGTGGYRQEIELDTKV